MEVTQRVPYGYPSSCIKLRPSSHGVSPSLCVKEKVVLNTKQVPGGWKKLMEMEIRILFCRFRRENSITLLFFCFYFLSRILQVFVRIFWRGLLHSAHLFVNE